jgi:transposase-like protein
MVYSKFCVVFSHQNFCFMSRPRRTFSAEQKSKIALEALRERHSLSEIAQKHEVHPSQITQWKKQAVDGLHGIFSEGRVKEEASTEAQTALLFQQIGQLQFELDWLKKKSSKL